MSVGTVVVGATMGLGTVSSNGEGLGSAEHPAKSIDEQYHSGQPTDDGHDVPPVCEMQE